MKLRRAVTAGAAALAAVLTTGGTAQAAPATIPPGGGAVVYNVGCWTSFDGPYQYYANCSAKPVKVCPALHWSDGNVTSITAYRTRLNAYDGRADSTDTAKWDWRDVVSAIPDPPPGETGTFYQTTVFC